MIHPDYALNPKDGKPSKVRIQWGLVQIPVRLALLTDAGSSVPSRTQWTGEAADASPVGNLQVDKVTGKALDAAIVKKVQVGDKFVVLTDEEIEAHSTTTKGLADIESFIPLAAIGSLYVIEKVKTWQPDTMKVGKNTVVDPSATKAAALLRSAMDKQQLAALVLVPGRAGGKYVALAPDGLAYELSFADQVRVIADSVDYQPSKAEMDLAAKLIDGIGIDTPVLVDETGQRLQAYLEAKAAGTETPITVEIEQAPTVDLLAALSASLAAVKPAKAPAKAKAARKAS